MPGESIGSPGYPHFCPSELRGWRFLPPLPLPRCNNWFEGRTELRKVLYLPLQFIGKDTNARADEEVHRVRSGRFWACRPGIADQVPWGRRGSFSFFRGLGSDIPEHPFHWVVWSKARTSGDVALLHVPLILQPAGLGTSCGGRKLQVETLDGSETWARNWHPVFLLHSVGWSRSHGSPRQEWGSELALSGEKNHSHVAKGVDTGRNGELQPALQPTVVCK